MIPGGLLIALVHSHLIDFSPHIRLREQAGILEVQAYMLFRTCCYTELTRVRESAGRLKGEYPSAGSVDDGRKDTTSGSPRSDTIV